MALLTIVELVEIPRNKTDSKVYPKLGDRVFMKIPGWKSLSKHPKLTYDISGPYRVTDISQNSAYSTEIFFTEL